MRLPFNKYYFLLILILFNSCIRRVNVPIRNGASRLVVEGSISTDSAPYIIKLSYSGQFNNAYLVPKQLFITDAKVTIEDDLGDSTLCQWVSDGSYQTTNSNFRGTVGRSYALIIRLSNGKIYSSKPEKIVPVPSIDSVSVVYDSTYDIDTRPTQLIVSVNTHDPPGIQNYYRWTAFGYIPRKSIGFGYNNHALCEQFLPNDQINVLSDQFIDGREILHRPVFYSPIYWHGIHFIEIKQYSISRNAYQFWQQYLAQTNRTGSILDPLPAPLIGNMYNQADSNDIALGLFSASDVYKKKIIIIPFFLQEYWLLSIAGEYIKLGDCQFVFPNTLPDDTDAPGWENAEEIDLR